MAKNTKYFDSGDYQVDYLKEARLKPSFLFTDGPSEGQREARLARTKVGSCPSSRPGAHSFLNFWLLMMTLLKS